MFGSGFHAGRIFGITIHIDWSWLVIFALVTWNLTTLFARLPATQAPILQWLGAAGLSLLFFGSVIVHELAHAWISYRQGLPVERITLFLLGGAANLQQEPPTPKIEGTTAIAGPMASLLMGAFWLALARFGQFIDLSGSSALEPLWAGFTWLGSVNLLLAAFNMIPGLPMDGGRVLRAIFWQMSGSPINATRWTSRVGSAIAWAMIALGLAMMLNFSLPLLGSGAISGLWLAFIGWFLNSASRQSYQQVIYQNLLSKVSVVGLMQRDIPTLIPDQTMIQILRDYGDDPDDLVFPVLRDHCLLGIITLSNVRAAPHAHWTTLTVADRMTPLASLVTISPHENVWHALNHLLQRGLRQMPVVRDNCEFLGLLRQRDILRWLEINQKAIG